MEDLNKIRKKIDKIDKQILELLIERKKQIKEVKEIKSTLNKPVKDSKREEAVLKKAKAKYEKEIFSKILEESRKLQE